MVKRKEPVNHSDVNCGTWMKSVTLKADQSLKQQSLSVVMRETATVIVLVFTLIFVPAGGHESDSKCICKSP